MKANSFRSAIGMVGASRCTTTNHLDKLTKREGKLVKEKHLRLPSTFLNSTINCIFHSHVSCHRPDATGDGTTYVTRDCAIAQLCSPRTTAATEEPLALLRAFHEARRKFGELLDFGWSCPLKTVTDTIERLVDVSFGRPASET